MHVSQGFCSDVSCARAFSLQPNDTRNDGCAVLVSSPDLRMSNAKEGREDCHGGVCSEKSLKFKRIKKNPKQTEVLLLHEIKYMKEVEVTNRKS